MISYVNTANRKVLNMRMVPNGAILAKIPNGTPLEVNVMGEWAQVTYQGKVGYVKSEFLSDVKQEKNITKQDLQTIYNSLSQTLKTIEEILK